MERYLWPNHMVIRYKVNALRQENRYMFVDVDFPVNRSPEKERLLMLMSTDVSITLLVVIFKVMVFLYSTFSILFVQNIFQKKEDVKGPK